MAGAETPDPHRRRGDPHGVLRRAGALATLAGWQVLVHALLALPWERLRPESRPTGLRSSWSAPPTANDELPI